ERCYGNHDRAHEDDHASPPLATGLPAPHRCLASGGAGSHASCPVRWTGSQLERPRAGCFAARAIGPLLLEPAGDASRRNRYRRAHDVSGSLIVHADGTVAAAHSTTTKTAAGAATYVTKATWSAAGCGRSTAATTAGTS